MQLRVAEQFEHFNLQDLQQFLRANLFGDQKTNAGPLSAEQEDHLFNLLDNLHKCQGIMIKGIWSILSLCFQNRSGFVLMTMFYNSNIKIEEAFHKKTFLRDIQFVQNANICHSNLKKIVSALNIKTLFFQKFKQFRIEIRRFREYRNSPITILDEQKIMGQDYYDSQPDLHYFENMLEDDQFSQNKSLKLYQNQFEQNQEQSIQQKEQTISLKRPISFGNVSKAQKRYQKEYKKSKRPNMKKRKEKISAHVKKIKQREKCIFVSVRKQKRKLRQKYKWLQQQYFLDEQLPQNIKRGQTKDAPVSESQEQDQLEEQKQLNAQNNFRKEVTQKKHRRHKRLKKNLNYEQDLINSEVAQEIQNISCEIQSEIQETKYNQSISNLKVIKICFPSSLMEFSKVFQEQMVDQFLFNYESWGQWVRASTSSRKHTMKLIRQLISAKNQVSLEHSLKLLHIVKMEDLKGYVQCYFEPLLVFSITQIVVNIVDELIQILYTSDHSYSVVSLFKQCEQLMKIQQHKGEKMKIGQYIHKAVKNLFEDFWDSNNTSCSNINFGKPKDLLLKKMRIKLSDSDLKQTILVVLLILNLGFFTHFESFNQNQLDQSFLKLLVQKHLNSHPSFLQHLSPIYSFYNFSIKTKQLYQKAMELVKLIDLNNKDKNILNMVADFVTMITSEYIQRKVKESEEKLNPMHIINMIDTNSFIVNLSKQNRQMKIQITINYYGEILQYKQLQSQKFINHIIKDINKPDYHENVSINLINLLAKIYKIIKERKNWQKIELAVLKEAIKNKLNFIMSKLMHFSQKSFYSASEQKIQKFCSLIEVIVTQIINIEQFETTKQSNSFVMEQHTFYLQLMLTCICPFLLSLNKCNQFIINLCQKCLTITYAIKNVIVYIKKYYSEKKDNIIDEEDEADQFYQIMQQESNTIKQYYNMINDKVKKSEIGKKINQSYANIKTNSHNIFYKMFGAVNALICQDEQSYKQIRVQLSKQLQIHARQIKIQTTNRQTKSTNKYILEFLRGFFQTTLIFQSHKLSNTVEKLQTKIKNDILNILYLRLVCQKQQKVIQIIGSALKCQGFKNCKYMLLKLPAQNQLSNQQNKSTTDLEFVFKLLLKTQPNFMINGQFEQFKKSNLQAIMTLYKEFYSQGRKQTIAFLSYNLLNIFVFLIKCNASEYLIRDYSPYFSINELSLNQSILKNACIEKNSPFSCQHLFVELFKQIQNKKKIALGKLCNSYFQFLATTEINLFRQNRQYEFTKMNLICSALSDYGQFSNYKPCRVDKNTYRLCKFLLSTFLQLGFIYAKYAVVNWFFQLFKLVPKLKQVLCNVFEQNFDRINNVINQMQKLNIGDCIQDKITKYILDLECDFQQLYKILWKSKNGKINSNKLNKYEQLTSLTNKCISMMLHACNDSSNEIVQGYNQFYNCLSQLSNQKYLFGSEAKTNNRNYEEAKSSPY